MVSVLAALVGMALCGCGSGTGGGGDGGATMTDAERQVGVAAADAQRAALPAGLSHAQQNAQLATYMATLPQFTRAETFGEGGGGGVIAEFADGQPYVIVNGPYAPPEAEASGLASIRARSGVPSGKKALLMRAMGPAFKDIRGTLRTMLTNAGYTVTQQQGSIPNLEAIRGPDVFYFDTHGIYKKDWKGAGKDLAAAWTTTPWPNPTYEARCAGADPELVRMTAVDSVDGTGKAVNANCYGVTTKFLKTRGITFAKNSLVYMDCCFLDLGGFKPACIAAGASLYASWTDPVLGPDASRAALYGFDRMTGADSGQPTKETPKQRPFDYLSVWADIQSRGWDRSDAAVLRYSTGTGDCGMLNPSIQFITLYEAPFYKTTKTKMEIAGLFGDDPGPSKRRVTIAETPVEVTEWAADKVTCDIPNFGEGSVGDVVVSVGDHKSNKVPLTEWNIRFTYTMRYWGSLKDTFHINAHIRADVHKWRDKPHQAPNTPSAVLFKGMGDMDGDWTSEGTGYQSNDPEQDRFVWSGSGQLSGEEALFNGEGTTAVGFVNVQSMILEINPCGLAGLNKTQDIYGRDGSHIAMQMGTWANWVPVFDEFVGGQTYLKIPLDSSFAIQAGSRTATSNIDGSPLSDGTSATMEWEAAEASFAPDPTIHASGLD